LAAAADNSALDRRERQQQACGNAVRLGSVAQSGVALPDICDDLAAFVRHGRGARSGNETNGADD
jgi:hypothetical protein